MTTNKIETRMTGPDKLGKTYPLLAPRAPQPAPLSELPIAVITNWKQNENKIDYIRVRVVYWKSIYPWQYIKFFPYTVSRDEFSWGKQREKRKFSGRKIWDINIMLVMRSGGKLEVLNSNGVVGILYSYMRMSPHILTWLSHGIIIAFI